MAHLQLIYFAAALGSIPSFKKTLFQFGLSKEDVEQNVKLLKEQSKIKHTFLCFDLVNPDKGVTIDRLSPLEYAEVEALIKISPEQSRTEAQMVKTIADKKEKLFTTIDEFLSDQSVASQKKGRFLFRLIYARIGDQIDPEDLSIKLSRGKKGANLSCVTATKSILNFILTLLDPKVELSCDDSELLEYLKSKGVTFPKAYVNNIGIKKYL